MPVDTVSALPQPLHDGLFTCKMHRSVIWDAALTGSTMETFSTPNTERVQRRGVPEC